MFKSIAKLLLASLLSVILTTSNTIAFHKNDNFDKDKIVREPSADITKKKLKGDYCTFSVTEDEEIIETKKIPKEKVGKEKEPLTDEEIDKAIAEQAKKEDGILSESVITKDIFIIKHFHTKEIKAAREYLDFSTLKNYESENGMRIIGPSVSIQEVLEYYCLQEMPKDDKSKKFKVKKGYSLAKLYNEIAEQMI